jgi:plastocyanin
MSRRLLAPLVTLGLAAAALVVAPAIALAGDPCFHAFDNRPAPSTGETTQVVLGDCVFTPTMNSVPVGTTVTWRNGSSQAHEVVGSNLIWGAHDKLLAPGDTIGWTFETAGVYAYSCMIHPGMTGVVVVGQAEGADLVAVAATDASGDPAADGTATLVIAAGAGVGGLAVGLALAALLRRRGSTPES